MFFVLRQYSTAGQSMMLL